MTSTATFNCVLEETSFQLHCVCGQILDQDSSLWLVGSLKSLCLHFPSNSFKRRLYLCQSIYLTPNTIYFQGLTASLLGHIILLVVFLALAQNSQQSPLDNVNCKSATELRQSICTPGYHISHSPPARDSGSQRNGQNPCGFSHLCCDFACLATEKWDHRRKL